MSELMNAMRGDCDFRRQLLTTVSALALSVSFWSGEANAEDAAKGRPTVWIELGAQLDSLSSAQEEFSPPFMASVTQANLLSTLTNVQRPLASAFGEEGKISFQPRDSEWVLSASVRYGRTSANRHQHQQTANKTVSEHFTYRSHYIGPKYFYPSRHVKFADGQSGLNETHAVIDFQAGKEVGLGLFGGQGLSVVGVGVRIAQFTSKSNVSLHVEPDVHYPTAPITSLDGAEAFQKYAPRFHDFAGLMSGTRSFRGLGPSLAWNASAPFLGDPAHGELSLNWGLNGAVLFGRQKANVQHKTIIHSYYMSQGWQGENMQGKLTPGHFNNGVYHTCHGERLDSIGIAPNTCHTNAPPGFNRARSVVVPNLGGTLGLSYRIEDFKVSLGYRADFFFGAIDDGIDVRKSEDIGFHGPFATISIGLGG